MLPTGVGEAEIDFFGYDGVEGGGYALEAGKFGVIRRGGRRRRCGAWLPG
jgi:hypothetical protein